MITHPVTGQELYTVKDLAEAANCTVDNIYHHMRDPITPGSWADQHPPQKVLGGGNTHYWTKTGLQAFVTLRNTNAGSHNQSAHITPRLFAQYRAAVRDGIMVLCLRDGQRIFDVQPAPKPARHYLCRLAHSNGSPSETVIAIHNRSYLYLREQ